jgi:hypothetical protein
MTRLYVVAPHVASTTTYVPALGGRAGMGGLGGSIVDRALE